MDKAKIENEKLSKEKAAKGKEIKGKATKERILEEALTLFAQGGYVGTSMSDIAAQIGVTKQALYKHYASKQEILISIVEKMDQMDRERMKAYEMPEGSMEEVVAGYKTMAIEKIKRFTQAQFLHWTEEDFASRFRKMLILEQYRNPEIRKLYQFYFTSGPISTMEKIFRGLTKNDKDAKQIALDFYGTIFFLYSLYDDTEDKQSVIDMLNCHVEKFSKHLLVK